MTERKLDGKVALITGGARGLGRGYALRLAALGALDHDDRHALLVKTQHASGFVARPTQHGLDTLRA